MESVHNSFIWRLYSLKWVKQEVPNQRHLFTGTVIDVKGFLHHVIQASEWPVNVCQIDKAT